MEDELDLTFPIVKLLIIGFVTGGLIGLAMVVI